MKTALLACRSCSFSHTVCSLPGLLATHDSMTAASGAISLVILLLYANQTLLMGTTSGWNGLSALMLFMNENQECDQDSTSVPHHAACVRGLFACIYFNCQCAACLELCVQLHCCSYLAQTLVTIVIRQIIHDRAQATFHFCRLL